MKVDLWLPGAWGGGWEMGMSANGYGFLFVVINMF